MRNISIIFGILFGLTLLLVSGQACSRSPKFSLQNLALHTSDGNGGTYDGKLIILHHYVDNFTCEGRVAPESILVQENGANWYFIRNTTMKCADTDHVLVDGVQYDEGANQAIFNGNTYVPPRPYFVNALENPNLPDVRLQDGVCADVNGVCSLRAAVEQAAATSVTEEVVVNVPEGTFLLTSGLRLFSSSVESKAVTIRGVDPTKTIIDGGNVVIPLSVAMATAAVTTVENITIQHGKGENGFSASAILPAGMGFSNSHLEINNCIFKSNINNAAIYGGPGSGNITIRKSQFVNNDQAAIQVYAVTSLLVEDSTIDSNAGIGIWVDNRTSNVTVRRSTISNNAQWGLSFNECISCAIENVTVSKNKKDGIAIMAWTRNPNFDITISDSTLKDNGLASGSNLSLSFYDSINKLTLSNSILTMTNSLKKNCEWVNPANVPTIVPIGNNINDSSCY